MPEMILYVKGPLREKTGWFKKKEIDVYLVNPQLYVGGDPNPAQNYGVHRYEFSIDKALDPEEFEQRIKKEAIDGLGGGVPLGKIIIPPHSISVSVEYDSGE